MDAPYPAVVSNTPFVKGQDYDSSATISEDISIKGNVVTRTFKKSLSDQNKVLLIAGPRDEAFDSQMSSY